MTKKGSRWPIWKIVVMAAGLALVAVVMFVLAAISGAAVEDDAEAAQAVLTLPTFLIMLGVAFGMLSALSVLWLVLRVREARMPVWERNERRRKRRRR
jgi:Na+/melibiose symporter-like transporter